MSTAHIVKTRVTDSTTPFFIIKFCYKIYSLSKNNSISKKLVSKLTCYKNHVRSSSMTMVIRFELRIGDQIDTSVSFDINGNPGTLKTIVCQTAPLAKLPPGGGGFLFIHEISLFQANCRFFKGMELISIKFFTLR